MARGVVTLGEVAAKAERVDSAYPKQLRLQLQTQAHRQQAAEQQTN